jgi:hypothetical protein
MARGVRSAGPTAGRSPRDCLVGAAEGQHRGRDLLDERGGGPLGGVDRGGQPRLAELVAAGRERFGDAVAVENQAITGRERGFGDRARPRLEQAEHGRRRRKWFEPAAPTHEQRRRMAAVGVAQAAGAIVVLDVDHRRVGVRRRRVPEALVDVREQARRVAAGVEAGRAHVRLQARHQQRGGHPLARNVGQEQRQPIVAEPQEVVVVPADAARLPAAAGVVETPRRRGRLRQETRLDVGGEPELVRGTALALGAIGFGAAPASSSRVSGSMAASMSAWPSGSSKIACAPPHAAVTGDCRKRTPRRVQAA